MADAVAEDLSRYLSDLARHPHLLELPYRPAPSAAGGEATYRLLLFSVLLGMEHAESRLTLADLESVYGYEALPFEEALSFARSRLPLSRKEFADLSERMRFRAFTVSRLSSLDAIERVRGRLQAAMQEGTSLGEWTAGLEDGELQAMAGWSQQKPWYWENVYRTNTQTAYNAGRALTFAKNPPAYLEFLGIDDTRQSEICALRSGTIRPYGDPWWQANWPPLHYQCRSTLRGIYRGEATSRGLKVSDLPAAAPVAQGGFGAHPLAADTYWKPTEAMLQRAESYGAAGDIISVGLRSGLSEAVEGWIAGYPASYTSPAGTAVRLAPARQRLAAASAAERAKLASEQASARFLADAGHPVVLLPQASAPGIVSPDALVGSRVMEFKRAQSLSAARKRLRIGLAQADHVYLEVPAHLSPAPCGRPCAASLPTRAPTATSPRTPSGCAGGKTFTAGRPRFCWRGDEKNRSALPRSVDPPGISAGRQEKR